VVSLIQVWKSIGIFMLVYIAGLSSIPDTLVQAARVDGAGRWQVLRHVKLPLLGPSFTFNIALSIIAGMQTFELIISTTQGGPGNATSVLNYLTWQTYSSGTYGYAAALNLSLFVLIFVLAIPAIVLLRRREVEG
jgi:raffinose/stachyose/melibiose transport system permease protein